jgi:aminopeptidase N
MMNKLIFLIFGATLLTGTNILAQQVPTKIFDVEKRAASGRFNNKSAPQTAEYDVHYYQITLDLNPAVRFIDGNVNVHFIALIPMDSVVLDFGNQLVVDSIVYQQNTYLSANSSGFNTLSFIFPNTISAGTFDSIQVFYRGTPRGNPRGTPFAQVPVTNGNLIWTLSEPYGAKDWWPCKSDLTDKADSVSIDITVPQGNKVASIGLLQGIDTVGTNLTYRWKTTYPTVAYLVAIGAGKYDFYQDQLYLNGDSILMEHYLLQNETQSQSISDIEEFMVFFDSLFGEYPFIKEKYGHASFTFGGGMEHQTMSFMGSYGGELKAHELAHQWFGNKVTCGSWSDLWLNESFATYLTGLTYEFGVVHSRNFWSVWLSQTEGSGFTYPNGSVYRYDTTNVNSLFNNQVYNKGAITLHTLRWKIGDSAFFSGVRNYITDASLAYGFARTPDLQAHLEASYGQSLSEFFNDWIYGKGYPRISTNWAQNGGSFNLTVQQTPSDTSVSFFEIPIPYRLQGPNLDTFIIVEPNSSNANFSIPISQTITSVTFDPNQQIFAQELFTTSLSNKMEHCNFTIYPNPTRDFIYIDTDLKLSGVVNIYAATGKLVYSKSATKRLDVNMLARGTYFIELILSDEVRRNKFVKQ